MLCYATFQKMNPYCECHKNSEHININIFGQV